MDINTNHFKTEKTARYSTYGNLSDRTKYFWFALHGSNMRCEQMLYKFSEFNPDEHFIVAPEGLNRHYEKGFGGDVVASWMTKRDRLEEISDFNLYLSSLYAKYSKLLPVACKKIVFGFSQGGTTIFRWLNANSVEVDYVLAYSCWIPEDIDLSSLSSHIPKAKLVYTYGLQDQFLTEERIQQVNDIITRNKLEVKSLPYAGEHRVDKGNLKSIFESYFV